MGNLFCGCHNSDILRLHNSDILRFHNSDILRIGFAKLVSLCRNCEGKFLSFPISLPTIHTLKTHNKCQYLHNSSSSGGVRVPRSVSVALLSKIRRWFFLAFSCKYTNIHVTYTERKGCDSNSAQGTQLACIGNLVSKVPTRSCIGASSL